MQVASGRTEGVYKKIKKLYLKMKQRWFTSANITSPELLMKGSQWLLTALVVDVCTQKIVTGYVLIDRLVLNVDIVYISMPNALMCITLLFLHENFFRRGNGWIVSSHSSSAGRGRVGLWTYLHFVLFSISPNSLSSPPRPHSILFAMRVLNLMNNQSYPVFLL